MLQYPDGVPPASFSYVPQKVSDIAADAAIHRAFYLEEIILPPNMKARIVNDPRCRARLCSVYGIDFAEAEAASFRERKMTMANFFSVLEPEDFAAFSDDEKARLAYGYSYSNLAAGLFQTLRMQLFCCTAESFRLYGCLTGKPWNDENRCLLKSWNAVAELCWAIKRFRLDLPDFDHHIDYVAERHGAYGYTCHSHTFIDGKLAYLIRWRGKHVLTIGFSISRHGVFVQQVQLKERKKNRWLFHLPMPLLDYVLARVAAAFGAHALWLVEGCSLAARCRFSYPNSIREVSMPLAECERVAASYDRDLLHFERSSETISSHNVTLIRLRPLNAVNPIEKSATSEKSCKPI